MKGVTYLRWKPRLQFSINEGELPNVHYRFPFGVYLAFVLWKTRVFHAHNLDGWHGWID